MHRLDFSHERDIKLGDIIRSVRSYYPDADFDLLEKSYYFAQSAHEGQKRSSGEDYFIHPLNVAWTLIKLRMDVYSIMAGLLHDVVEDCDIPASEIEEKFGVQVAQIVVGLTKISKIKFKSKEESKVENFRKMVVAMAKDLRVIIVKLADRMHNMRTLQYVSTEKQNKVAMETIDIYVPLAARLGISSVKCELEDLCLRFLHPEVYYRLAEKISMKRSERDLYIKKVIGIINDKLLEYSLRSDTTGRPKHFYSIYKKMISRGVDFEQIQDILAFRVLVSNITECYKTLGIIHSSFTPIPGRFKDYIAIPKVNNYQSLHTTVIGPGAERIEIQIRTNEMDQVAETGVAAHWKYKEGIASGNANLTWVQELLEYNRDVTNNDEFMVGVKNDLDVGGVFVFTPKGDVYELRFGATPLDFAYAIHTEVGNHCIGAKVNSKMVSLRYSLKSGDSVQILTSDSQSPSKDWLKIVKSSRAKNKIKQWLLRIEREGNKEVGKEILDRTLRACDTSIKALKKKNEWDRLLEKFNVSNEEEFCIHIGSGKFRANHIIEAIPSLERFVENKEKRKEIEEVDSYSQKLTKIVRKRSSKDNTIIVDGMLDVLVRMGKCCNPVPGDPISGHITRGRGITVHTASCHRVDHAELTRIIGVEWNEELSFKHPVNIRVITHDKPGILSVISRNINNLGINIRAALAKSLPDRKGSFVFEIEVRDFSELIKTIHMIEGIEEVISVTRV